MDDFNASDSQSGRTCYVELKSSVVGHQFLTPAFCTKRITSALRQRRTFRLFGFRSPAHRQLDSVRLEKRSGGACSLSATVEILLRLAGVNPNSDAIRSMISACRFAIET